MAALSLLALILAWGATSLKGVQTRQGAHALAAVLAEELAQARQTAIATQDPVAVCFPSQGGSTACSHSFYTLSGQGSPRVQRTKALAADFPGTLICNAIWPLQPPLTASLGSPPPGSKWSRFRTQDWLPAFAQKDFCLVFLPDGSARSHLLPSFGGAYHVLVSNGPFDLRPGPTPAGLPANVTRPGYFQLGGVGACQTVRVDAGGAIALVEGLEGGISLPQSGQAPAVAPPLVRPASTAPDVEMTPSALPRRNPLVTEPLPINVTVNPDGFVTLEARAQDRGRSGERLYSAWRVEPRGSAPAGGAFSLPTAPGRGQAMEWDPVASQWRSTWQWAPPPGVASGSLYDLTLSVQDKDGRPLIAEVALPLKVLPPGKIVYSSDRTGTWQVYTMNVDGTDQRRLHLYPFTEDSPRWSLEAQPSTSLDGSRVVVVADEMPYWPTMQLRQVYLTDRQGSRRIRLSGTPARTCARFGGGTIDCPDELTCSCEGAAISPIGNWVAYRRHDPDNSWNLVLRHANGAADPTWVHPVGPRQGAHLASGGPVLTPRFMNDHLAWGADNKTLYYTQAGDDTVTPPVMKIYRVDVEAQTETLVTGASWQEHAPMVHNGNLYSIAEAASGNTTLHKGGAPFFGSGRQRYEMPQFWRDPTDGSWHVLSVLNDLPYPTALSNAQVYRFPLNSTLGDDTPMVQLTDVSGGNNVWPVYVR